MCVLFFGGGGGGFRAYGYLEVHGADHLLLVMVPALLFCEVSCLRPVRWAIGTHVVKAGYE